MSGSLGGMKASAYSYYNNRVKALANALTGHTLHGGVVTYNHDHITKVWSEVLAAQHIYYQFAGKDKHVNIEDLTDEQ